MPTDILERFIVAKSVLRLRDAPRLTKIAGRGPVDGLAAVPLLTGLGRVAWDVTPVPLPHRSCQNAPKRPLARDLRCPSSVSTKR